MKHVSKPKLIDTRSPIESVEIPSARFHPINIDGSVPLVKNTNDP